MANNLQISMLLDFYGDMLTDKQQEVLALYYNEDLSLAEIAEITEVVDKKTGLTRHPTRQAVRDSIKRAEVQLFQMESRLGLASRFTQMQEGLEQIIEQANKIGRYNERYTYNTQVAKCCDIIIDTAKKLRE